MQGHGREGQVSEGRAGEGDPSEGPPGASLIRASGLGKRYGDKRVLDGLDFEVDRGGFMLVTGPNGSGKTTLLRLCAGLATPTAGVLDLRSPREAIGFAGHEPLVYRELTAIENLDLYGRLYRVPERRERIGMLLERFGLWQARNERAGSFSRGMQQRLSLCRALLHEPELLVLDEPYSGLDDAGTALLDRELAELRPHATFVVSTHDPERVLSLASTRLAFA
jgi:heme exporter protein A